MYTGSVLMIFKQYTLNGKRRVSNGKRHVIQRKQTRENVCGLCQSKNLARRMGTSSSNPHFEAGRKPSCKWCFPLRGLRTLILQTSLSVLAFHRQNNTSHCKNYFISHCDTDFVPSWKGDIVVRPACSSIGQDSCVPAVWVEARCYPDNCLLN